ncbi:MAG: hypothetical protein ACFCUE_03485 [Candidatus Bathyarchaeia archaeon]
MNSSIKFKIGLLLPILVLVGFFAAFWAASILYTPPEQRPRPVFIQYDFEFFYFAHAIISTLNVALLVVLLITFISVYKKTKSEFSFGLIIFGFAFLLKDIVSSPFTVSAFSFYVSGLGPFIVLPDLFEFAALSVLLYLSIKY